MHKAIPGHKGRNGLRRDKCWTYIEWRYVFTPTFNKVLEDIYKNMKVRVNMDDLPDIRQHLEESFFRYYVDFIIGDDRYEFPPTGGAFYQRNSMNITTQFIYCQLGQELQVYSSEHDVIARQRDESSLVDFHEEREKRHEVEQNCSLCLYLEQYLGISLDSEFGPEFAFWWMGYNYRDISAMLTMVNKGRGSSYPTIQRRVSKALEVIEIKYGIPRREIKQARRTCMNIAIEREASNGIRYETKG